MGRRGLKSDGQGRNDPCPCGSGKKYKKCCLAKVVKTEVPPEVFHIKEQEIHQRRRAALQMLSQIPLPIGRPILDPRRFGKV